MDKKSILIRKIIMGICAAITVIIGAFYIYEMFVLVEASYFTKHFALFISLFAIGIIALLLPSINQKKYSRDSKGENTMVIVAFLLFACSILSIIISYIG